MSISVNNLKRLVRRQRGCCAYCRRNIIVPPFRDDGRQKPHWATLDHVMPKSAGFTRENNQVAACPACNRAKGSMTASEFRAVLAARQKGTEI